MGFSLFNIFLILINNVKIKIGIEKWSVYTKQLVSQPTDSETPVEEHIEIPLRKSQSES